MFSVIYPLPNWFSEAGTVLLIHSQPSWWASSDCKSHSHPRLRVALCYLLDSYDHTAVKPKPSGPSSVVTHGSTPSLPPLATPDTVEWLAIVPGALLGGGMPLPGYRKQRHGFYNVFPLRLRSCFDRQVLWVFRVIVSLSL